MIASVRLTRPSSLQFDCIADLAEAPLGIALVVGLQVLSVSLSFALRQLVRLAKVFAARHSLALPHTYATNFSLNLLTCSKRLSFAPLKNGNVRQRPDCELVRLLQNCRNPCCFLPAPRTMDARSSLLREFRARTCGREHSSVPCHCLDESTSWELIATIETHRRFVATTHIGPTMFTSCREQLTHCSFPASS